MILLLLLLIVQKVRFRTHVYVFSGHFLTFRWHHLSNFASSSELIFRLDIWWGLHEAMSRMALNVFASVSSCLCTSRWQITRRTISEFSDATLVYAGSGQSPEGRGSRLGKGQHHLDFKEQRGEGTSRLQKHFAAQSPTVSAADFDLSQGARWTKGGTPAIFAHPICTGGPDI